MFTDHPATYLFLLGFLFSVAGLSIAYLVIKYWSPFNRK